MTREYIRAVKAKYSIQQHQSIIEAYLFKELSVEEIASSYNAGEMDITVILSSYRILMSCDDTRENVAAVKSAAEQSDRAIIMGQYAELYHDSVLADVSPVVYFKNAEKEEKLAEQQKESIDRHLEEVKITVKKKKRGRKNIASVLSKIFAALIFLSLIITLPMYVYNSGKAEGDKNPDLSIYVYDVDNGSYGGQGQIEPSGLGRLFTEGYEYAGQFARGEMRGIGSFVVNDRVSYIGGVYNGVKSGMGLEYVRAEGAVIAGIRKNGLLQGTGIRIKDNIIEMYEYNGGEIRTTIAIGNYKDINFNIKQSDCMITKVNGYYRLGKTSELDKVTGYIVEWNEQGEGGEPITVYFNEYKDGTLMKSLSYNENGEAMYITRDFMVTATKEVVLCSEQSGAQDLSIQFNFREEEKPLLFGKRENDVIIKLGKLLQSGEIVF